MSTTKNNYLTPELCRAARALLRLRQHDLAEAAGLGPMVVSDFETGSRNPRRASLEALKRALEEKGANFIFPEENAPWVGLFVDAEIFSEAPSED